MRPLAVLNAIIFGSAAAITFGLLGVVVIFLVLKGSNPAMGSEFPALLRSSGVFLVLAAVSGASLAGAAHDPEMALAGTAGDVGDVWPASPRCTGPNEDLQCGRACRFYTRIYHGENPQARGLQG